MPRTIKTADEMDREVMLGGPQGAQHGNPPPEDNDEGGEEDQGGDDGDKSGEKTVEEQLAELRAENARLQGTLDGLSRRPPEPQQKPQKKEKPKRDWEKMLFENTEEGIETLKQDLREEIRDELRSEYQKDTGEREFWRDFYAENKDLDKSKDDDIVRATLNKNIGTLGDMPVGEAIKKLGELTRERIIQYTGKKKTEGDPKTKAQVEGAGEKTPKPAKKPEDNVVSLGDIIRGRKQARAAAMAKAQTA